jgi:hypothetical protein
VVLLSRCHRGEINRWWQAFLRRFDLEHRFGLRSGSGDGVSGRIVDVGGESGPPGDRGSLGDAVLLALPVVADALADDPWVRLA